MRGSHHLWSITQKRVTLSSAEAELGALVKASAEVVGISQVVQGFGKDLDVQIMVDSSAALAVTQRKGNGKLRHVRIGQMWVQQLAEEEGIKFDKVKGDYKPADLGTKHLKAEDR